MHLVSPGRSGLVDGKCHADDYPVRLAGINRRAGHYILLAAFQDNSLQWVGVVWYAGCPFWINLGTWRIRHASRGRVHDVLLSRA